MGESELLQPLVDEANVITDEERIIQVYVFLAWHKVVSTPIKLDNW